MTPEQIIAKLKGLSRKVKRLQNVRYEGRDWRLIEDELDKFLKTNLGDDAAWAVHNALNPDRIRVRMDAYPVGDKVDPKWKAERVEAIQTELQIFIRDIESGYLVPAGDAAQPQAKEKFIPAGRQHDAYAAIRDIVELATESITIVDPYVDRTLFQLLANVKRRIAIRVLTGTTPSDFDLELDKFRKQGYKIEARRGVDDFHDRFILLDGRCFHLGASIKDAGSRGFMIQELEDASNVTSIRKNIETAWNGVARAPAKPHPPPP